MQLVNQTCIHCRGRIAREAEGRFCPKCGSAVHLACSERALSASTSGCCRACGVPTAAKEQHKGPQQGRPNAAGAARGYHTTLLGVAMMVCGILGSIVFSGAGVNGLLVTAGGAILGGVVLVAVGFLQSTRR
jgi:hypothetical protein